ncbi:MAG: M23 family metallopeptidase [Pseudomonadota bacterium]
MLRILAASLLASSPAIALDLQSPVACEIGADCFIQQYVDHDPGPDARDTFCSTHTYDGHKGTDFALADLAAMARGVAVTAIAPGKVRATRDGMVDALQSGDNAPDVTGRECGNAVILDHEGGWSSQYCHMRQGSVAVSSGDLVEAGDELGLIGLSGRTQFPHLHLALRRGEEVIDPFDGTPMSSSCNVEGDTLWAPDAGVAFTPGGLIGAGFQTVVPDYDAIKASSPHASALPVNAPALVTWAHFFGLEEGDRLRLTLIAPDGSIVSEATHVMDRNRAREFRAVGRKRRVAAWEPGIYRGVALLMRDGREHARREISTRLR